MAFHKCKYDKDTPSIVSCAWCGDHLCATCGYIVENERACNECYAEIQQCEHQCTGNCRREGCNCACGEFHKVLATV